VIPGFINYAVLGIGFNRHPWRKIDC